MFALPRLPAHSLRRRALWPTLGCAAALLVVTIALLHVMFSQILAERMRSRSVTIAHIVANAVESERDAVRLRRIVTALGAEPQIDLITVTLGSPPRVIAATHSEWTDHAIGEVADSRLAAQMGGVQAGRRESGTVLRGTSVMSYVVPIQLDTPGGLTASGAVAVLVDGQTLRTQTNGWLWQFSVVLLAFEALALVVAEFGLRRYVLRPVHYIAEAATLLRAGDRTARAHVHADDEIGRLATTLNELQAQLNTTIGELEFQKLTLDQAATVAVTDAQGTILYVNDAFCRLSGYSRDELVGQNPRVVNSQHHPREFFRDMYETLAAGRV